CHRPQQAPKRVLGQQAPAGKACPFFPEPRRELRGVSVMMFCFFAHSTCHLLSALDHFLVTEALMDLHRAHRGRGKRLLPPNVMSLEIVLIFAATCLFEPIGVLLVPTDGVLKAIFKVPARLPAQRVL